MSGEKESFVFYRSFYEALQDLKDKDRLKVYDAICELAMNNKETELTGMSKTIFTLIKPQILANTKRYENGKKGGRPKKETIGFVEKETIGLENEETKPKPNENVNVNENANVNVNVNENAVVSFFVEKYKKSGFMKLEDKIRFLREIKKDEKYQQVSEEDEYRITDYVLKN